MIIVSTNNKCNNTNNNDSNNEHTNDNKSNDSRHLKPCAAIPCNLVGTRRGLCSFKLAFSGRRIFHGVC